MRSYISSYILKIGGWTNPIGETNRQLESLLHFWGMKNHRGVDIFEVYHRGTAMADFEPTSKPGRFRRLQMGGGAQVLNV